MGEDLVDGQVFPPQRHFPLAIPFELIGQVARFIDRILVNPEFAEFFRELVIAVLVRALIQPRERRCFEVFSS